MRCGFEKNNNNRKKTEYLQKPAVYFVQQLLKFNGKEMFLMGVEKKQFSNFKIIIID